MKTICAFLFSAVLLSPTMALARTQQAETSDSKMVSREASVNDETPSTSPFSLTLLSFLYGPSVGDPGSGVAPDTFISDRDGLSIQNQLGLAYNVNDKLSIAPVMDFELYLTDPSNLYDKPQHFSLAYDSYIRATYTNMVSFDLGANTLSFNSDLRYYVPTSEFSRDNRSLGSLRLSLNPTLQFAHSPFALTLVNFIRYYLQRQDSLTNNPTLGLPHVMYYTGPIVSYQINDHLQLWNLLEATVTYDTQGVANTTDPDRSLVDFEPGADIKISEKVTLSPYLNWFLNRSIKTTSINLMATVSM